MESQTLAVMYNTRSFSLAVTPYDRTNASRVTLMVRRSPVPCALVPRHRAHTKPAPPRQVDGTLASNGSTVNGSLNEGANVLLVIASKPLVGGGIVNTSIRITIQRDSADTIVPGAQGPRARQQPGLTLPRYAAALWLVMERNFSETDSPDFTPALLDQLGSAMFAPAARLRAESFAAGSIVAKVVVDLAAEPGAPSPVALVRRITAVGGGPAASLLQGPRCAARHRPARRPAHGRAPQWGRPCRAR